MFDFFQLHEKLSLKTSNHSDFCVALSGGLDSIVLLHALKTLQNQFSFNLRAVHIHHGLSDNADDWENHCRSICAQWQIPLIVKKVKIAAAGESIEAAARESRYAALKEELLMGEILLTAHTQNDQVETLLLQLLRGAGPKGMAAMPEKIKIAANYFIRPLLDVTRAELEAYAMQHQLSWIEDESNEDRRFDRNFIRHDVLPVLQKRWPQVLTTIHRSATHCAEATELMEVLALEDLEYCQGEKPAILKIEELLKLSRVRQKNLIRYWLQHLQFTLPSQQKLDAILNEVVLSSEDAMPLIVWQGVEIRRFKQQIYVMAPLSKPPKELVLNWDISKPLSLPNQLGVLTATWQQAQGIALSENEILQIRFRKGGERMHPHGRQGSHPLKKLLQEWNIPPWLRDRIPLLYHQDELVAVIGYAISAKYVVSKNEKGLVVAWS